MRGNKNLFYGAGSLTDADRAYLATKWSPITEGLLDPTERREGRKTHTGRVDAHLLREKKRVLEYILESQQAHNMTNPDQSGTKVLTESSTTSDIGSFATVALALQRKILPRDIFIDLFSTIPISQPGGKVFTLDFQRDSGGTSLAAKADFDKDYAETTEGGSVPQVKTVMSSANITMYTKKLRGISTIEMQQDFRNYYGLDADQELLAAEADEILREAGYEMLVATVVGATAGNVNFTRTVPAGLDYVNRLMYKKTLYEAVVSAQNKVYSKKYCKPNWAVGGVAENELLEVLEEFKLSPEAADGDHSIGRHYSGSINRRLSLYTDPWWQSTDKILFGRRGTGLEMPAVYSPHTLYVSPSLVDANDMTSRRGIMMRFGFTITNGDYFSTLTLQDSV